MAFIQTYLILISHKWIVYYPKKVEEFLVHSIAHVMRINTIEDQKY